MTDYSERDTEQLMNFSKDQEMEYGDSNIELENQEGEQMDINIEDYDDLRNTLSLSGRETEGQSLILSKCKELIEKLREELLEEKGQNTDLREKVLKLNDQLKDRKGVENLESQLLDMDEISKTIMQMNEKVEGFQNQAMMSTKMNEKLKELLQEKDKIINKMKEEIDSVVALKDEIPSILDMNTQLNQKLQESEQRVQSLLKRNKDSEDIESQIKRLQGSLEQSKKAILQLADNNNELKEKNALIEKEKDLIEQENTKLDELKTEQENEMEKLFDHQEKLKEMLQEVGNDLKMALEENQSLKQRFEQENRVNTQRRLEEARKKDKDIQRLNKKLAMLKEKDENNRIVIEKMNEETHRLKDTYEQKLVDEKMINSQRQIMAERLEQELHKNAQDINEMSNQFDVSKKNLKFSSKKKK